jgi:glycosyltransferase involved in cell wall biosynthesis
VFEPVALRRELRAALAGADVVHAHGFLYLGTAVAFAAARGGSRPARVLTEHVAHVDYSNPAVDAAERAAIATLGRACVRAADAAVTYNDRVARELLDLAPGVSITHIGNGVDTSLFRPAEGDERTRLRSELGWDELPRLLFVGRLVAKKGIGLAVAAATELAGSCELVLAGPGRPETPLPPHVRVLGEQPPEEIARLMRAADVFLLPSRGEGFPLTAQEAMASGLPVILADDPGYRSVLEGAGDGVRLAAQEPEAVTAAVRELLESGDQRAAAARAAAGFARSEFSWERAADQHEHLYDNLLGERSSASAST